MPTKSATAKPTGVKTLARLRAERDEFERREHEARRAAAIELGEAVLKAADLSLEPAQLNQLIAAAMRHGFEAAMTLLSSAKPDSLSARSVPEITGELLPVTDAERGTDHVAQ